MFLFFVSCVFVCKLLLSITFLNHCFQSLFFNHCLRSLSSITFESLFSITVFIHFSSHMFNNHFFQALFSSIFSITFFNHFFTHFFSASVNISAVLQSQSHVVSRLSYMARMTAHAFSPLSRYKTRHEFTLFQR